MGRFLDAALVFARDHVRMPAIGVAVALVLAGLSVRELRPAPSQCDQSGECRTASNQERAWTR
jgi:hypothetical protein